MYNNNNSYQQQYNMNMNTNYYQQNQPNNYYYNQNQQSQNQNQFYNQNNYSNYNQNNNNNYNNQKTFPGNYQYNYQNQQPPQQTNNNFYGNGYNNQMNSHNNLNAQTDYSYAKEGQKILEPNQNNNVKDDLTGSYSFFRQQNIEYSQYNNNQYNNSQYSNNQYNNNQYNNVNNNNYNTANNNYNYNGYNNMNNQNNYNMNNMYNNNSNNNYNNTNNYNNYNNNQYNNPTNNNYNDQYNNMNNYNNNTNPYNNNYYNNDNKQQNINNNYNNYNFNGNNQLQNNDNQQNYQKQISKNSLKSNQSYKNNNNYVKNSQNSTKLSGTLNSNEISFEEEDDSMLDCIHEHSLIKSNINNEKCKICNEIISNGFKCDDCKLILCEKCFTLISLNYNAKKKHKHNLILIGRSAWKCNLCQKANYMNTNFYFYCDDCNFGLCPQCYCPKPKENDDIHEHPLRFSTNLLNEQCCLCKEKIQKNRGYVCDVCRFNICYVCSCGLFGYRKNKNMHEHNLMLTFKNNWRCKNCGKNFENSLSMNCKKCNVDYCCECYSA